jgi:rhamnosyltransferase
MSEVIAGKTKPVTVIMRSYNEMPHTPASLEALFRQRFTDFDVIAVDSGSTDGSVAVFEQWRQRVKGKFDFHFIQIPKSEYGHGKTLNMAIGKTQAKIVVLLNADATPVDEYWLERLIAPFEKDEKIAATFSRQLVRAGTRPLIAFDAERFFPAQDKEYHWKYMIHYSQSASAIRHSVWEQRPYYTDAYASEDEEWAKWWIDRGYRIVYVPDSMAFHSHPYTLAQYRHRMYTEAIADMFVFPDLRPSILRLLKGCAHMILLDWAWCVPRGHLVSALYSPVFRVTQQIAFYRGQKEGEKLRAAKAAARK